MTPDRLEKLNVLEFVWSLKGRAPKDEGMLPDDISDTQVAGLSGMTTMQSILPKMEHHHQAQMMHHQMNHPMNQPQFVQPNYQMHLQKHHHHQEMSESMKEIADEAIHHLEKGNANAMV